MHCYKPKGFTTPRRSVSAGLLGGGLLVCLLGGCGGSSSTTKVAPSQPAPQNYFAPFVEGTTNNGVSIFTPQIYTLDDVAKQFSQSTFQLAYPQVGSQVLNSGTLAVNQRGLRTLTITANYTNPSTNGYVANVPSQQGSYAFELSDQGGALVQLLGQPVAPLAAGTACPSAKTAQTYLFVTIPGSLNTTGAPAQFAWDPATETAYGTADVSASGGAVSFANIHQFTLPAAGSAAPSQPSAASVSGTCAPTAYGNLTNVPGQVVITNPGLGAQQSIPPQAAVAINPASGFLVEDNGTATYTPSSGTASTIFYNNVLGAGTGAVGLPKPSAALSTSAVVGAQYLGFIYEGGTYVNSSNPGTFASHLASFGFSTVPSTCASVATASSTLIYGGDFSKDDPSTSSDGFANCDFAVDLGAQDSATNGLFPHANVTVGSAYAGNMAGVPESFPAVAIAGQLNGKYAIFLIGADSTQPWAIYLLQSN